VLVKTFKHLECSLKHLKWSACGRFLVAIGKDGAGLVHDATKNYQPIKMFSDESAVELPLVEFFSHGEETLLAILSDQGKTVLV
jgi:hypothetical protein